MAEKQGPFGGFGRKSEGVEVEIQAALEEVITSFPDIHSMVNLAILDKNGKGHKEDNEMNTVVHLKGCKVCIAISLYQLFQQEPELMAKVLSMCMEAGLVKVMAINKDDLPPKGAMH